MPARWTSELDVALLLALIEAAEVKPTGLWPDVVSKMGEGYTVRGVVQHYDQLKKRVAAGGVFAAASNTATAPTTPKTPKSPKTPRKRKGADLESPSKKPAPANKKSKTEHANNDSETEHAKNDSETEATEDEDDLATHTPKIEYNTDDDESEVFK